jgi:hypothetical protein
MTALVVWGLALALYLAFRRWYDARRPLLSPAEIDAFLARLPEHSRANVREVATLREFVLRDDGREFFMLNLVKLAGEPVPDPATGKLTPAGEVLEGYTRVFFRALLRKASHPALAARVIGGYIDTWNVEQDPGWSIIGYMRYRSRRDLLELVTDPRFADAHRWKIAATPVTLSFPTSPRILVLASPRVTAALLIALLAALTHLALR